VTSDLITVQQATEDVQQGLTQDDFDVYYEVWQKFDEQGTQFLHLNRLSEFVDTLEPPLRLPAPNYCKLISLDIPIYEGDVVHCLDVLDALTQNFLGTTRESTGQLGDLKKGPERTRCRLATSTMQRRREEYCARVIQAAWRNRVAQSKALRQLAEQKQASVRQKNHHNQSQQQQNADNEEIEAKSETPKKTRFGFGGKKLGSISEQASTAKVSE
jgi:hypothetical protein